MLLATTIFEESLEFLLFYSTYTTQLKVRKCWCMSYVLYDGNSSYSHLRKTIQFLKSPESRFFTSQRQTVPDLLILFNWNKKSKVKNSL